MSLVETGLLEESGIYSFYCKEEDKRYIGQAINLKTRYQQHVDALNKNKHKNKKLQDAWNAYGPLEYSVIEQAPKFKLNHLEDLYIKAFDAVNNGYNNINGSTKVILDGKEILELTESNKDMDVTEHYIKTVIEEIFDVNSEPMQLEPYTRLKRLITFLTGSEVADELLIDVFDRLNIECFDQDKEYIPEPTLEELPYLSVQIYSLKLTKKQRMQINAHNDKLRSDVLYRVNCSLDALIKEYYNFCIDTVDHIEELTLAEISKVSSKKKDYRDRILLLENEKVELQSSFLVIY